MNARPVLDCGGGELRSSADMRANLRPPDHLSGGAIKPAAADRSGAVRGAVADRAQAERASAQRVPGPSSATTLRNFCHRDEKSGWKVDKRVRDTGPWIGIYANGHWAGNYFGTHAPVMVWYSPEMYAWLKVNRPDEGALPPGEATPVPDGAIIVKEMYRRRRRLRAGRPDLSASRQEGAAIMVRDSGRPMTAGSGAGSDGTIGSRTGRSGAAPRISVHGLRPVLHELPSSAKDNQTFSCSSIKGEPRRAARLPQPALLPRSIVAEPARRASRRPRPRRAATRRGPLQPGLQSGPSPVGRGGRSRVRSRRCPRSPTTTSG